MANLVTRYFCSHAFSIIALSSICGDCCYLGYAFAAEGFVSVPKLIGALSAILSHVFLLAYGDAQAKHIAEEQGMITRLVLFLRWLAQRAVGNMPQKIQQMIRAKPVGFPFSMLALNGVGLLCDAIINTGSFAMLSQVTLGGCIALGCSFFALADFLKNQKYTNILLKVAAVTLTAATTSSIFLAGSTGNVFIITNSMLFLIGNFAAFYTKIDKKEPGSVAI